MILFVCPCKVSLAIHYSFIRFLQIVLIGYVRLVWRRKFVIIQERNLLQRNLNKQSDCRASLDSCLVSAEQVFFQCLVIEHSCLYNSRKRKSLSFHSRIIYNSLVERILVVFFSDLLLGGAVENINRCLISHLSFCVCSSRWIL